MHEFQAELTELVAGFVSDIAELARLAAREMVEEALRTEGVTHRDRKKRAKGVGARSNADGLTGQRLDARPNLGQALREFERQYIDRALTEHHGNITHAANALGTTRQALQRKLRRLSPSPRKRTR